MKPSVIGELAVETFLEDYWQKAPVLLKSGLTEPPRLSADDILALAAQDGVEARLITHNRNRWSLELGPFSQRELQELPSTDWSLLVSDMEQHVETLQELIGCVDFLPSWRVDDVMANLCARGGSVGPHYDSYDVFLIQLTGKKRWQVSSDFDRDDLLDDCDLRILNSFAPQREWVLEPGDVLYLPPNVAHYGVAETAGITLSLGCRSPSERELFTHLAVETIDRAGDEPAHADPDLVRQTEPHVLSEDVVDALMDHFKRSLELDAEERAASIARLLTRPKAVFSEDFGEPLDEDEVDHVLASAKGLRRARGSRWLTTRASDGLSLFVNAELVARGLDPTTAEQLCRRTLDAEQVRRWKQNEARSKLLRDLVSAGLLVASH